MRLDCHAEFERVMISVMLEWRYARDHPGCGSQSINREW
jgi:hypothetical protein